MADYLEAGTTQGTALSENKADVEAPRGKVVEQTPLASARVSNEVTVSGFGSFWAVSNPTPAMLVVYVLACLFPLLIKLAEICQFGKSVP